MITSMTGCPSCESLRAQLSAAEQRYLDQQNSIARLNNTILEERKRLDECLRGRDKATTRADKYREAMGDIAKQYKVNEVEENTFSRPEDCDFEYAYDALITVARAALGEEME